MKTQMPGAPEHDRSGSGTHVSSLSIASRAAPLADRHRAGRTAWRWVVGVVLALAVSAANVGAWNYLNPPIAAPDVSGKVAGLAYNAFQRWDSPLDRRYP